MGEILQYGRGVQRRSRLLVSLANVTLVYPLMLACYFYADWLAAWYLLGHVPRPTLDDPKDIAGLGVVDDLSGVFLLAMGMAATLGIVVTSVYGVKGQFRVTELAVRLAVFVMFWMGAFVLLRVDPGGVMNWWFD